MFILTRNMIWNVQMNAVTCIIIFLCFVTSTEKYLSHPEFTHLLSFYFKYVRIWHHLSVSVLWLTYIFEINLAINHRLMDHNICHSSKIHESHAGQCGYKSPTEIMDMPPDSNFESNICCSLPEIKIEHIYSYHWYFIHYQDRRPVESILQCIKRAMIQWYI